MRERPALGVLRVRNGLSCTWSRVAAQTYMTPKTRRSHDLAGQAVLKLGGQNVWARMGFMEAQLTETHVPLRQGRGKAGEQGDQVT